MADIQDAVAAALPHVLDVTRSLGRLGKHVHFHLHDGHPLVPGLRDHFSFLTRLPIPFSYQGRRSLNMMYGPGGLASIVSTAIDACPPQKVSFTIEVHQVEGRLPLSDAAWLFDHWHDTTNAERMNYWLSVLSENAMLMAKAFRLCRTGSGLDHQPAGRRGDRAAAHSSDLQRSRLHPNLRTSELTVCLMCPWVRFCPMDLEVTGALQCPDSPPPWELRSSVSGMVRCKARSSRRCAGAMTAWSVGPHQGHGDDREGDLIIGKDCKSAVGTLVERSSPWPS